MITEDYVSFGTAKLLKKRGFDEKNVDLWYGESGEMFYELYYDIKYSWRIKNNEKVFQCPTLQMAMKWLREVHNLFIGIEYANIVGLGFTYSATISNLNGDYCYCIYEKSYEEACEEALKYTLENLI